MNTKPPVQSQAHFVSSEHCSWTFSQACNHTFPEGGGVKLGTPGGGGGGGILCVWNSLLSLMQGSNTTAGRTKFTDPQPRLMVKVH